MAAEGCSQKKTSQTPQICLTAYRQNEAFRQSLSVDESADVRETHATFANYEQSLRTPPQWTTFCLLSYPLSTFFAINASSGRGYSGLGLFLLMYIVISLAMATGCGFCFLEYYAWLGEDKSLN